MTKITEAFDRTYFSREAYKGVKFSRFSQYWWSNRFYALLAKKFGPGNGRVLEIGCGMGDLLAWFPRSRYEVYGTDINFWALLQAKERVPEVEFVLLRAEDLKSIKTNSINILIIKHVVEHLEDPLPVIQEIERILSPGGLLILATPNLDSKMRGVKKEKWIGYRDPTHISLKNTTFWIDQVNNINLQVIKSFSDGFWDAPYIAFLPNSIQKIFFGLPGGIQAIMGWMFLPIPFGESLILLAKKP